MNADLDLSHLLVLYHKGSFKDLEDILSGNDLLSKDLRYLNILCSALSKLKKVPDAIEIYLNQFNTFKTNPIYLSNLSAFFFEDNDYENSLRYVLAAYELDPENEAIVENLTATYAVLKRWANVESVLMSWEKQRALSEGMLFHRGLSFQESGQLIKALEVYKKILSLNSRHSGARTNAIVCANRLQLYDAALSLSVDQSTVEDQIIYNRGQTLWLMGRTTDAYTTFNSCIDYIKNHAHAYSEWLRFLRECGYYKELDALEFNNIEKPIKTLVVESGVLKDIGDLSGAREKLEAASLLVSNEASSESLLRTIITSKCLLSNYYITDPVCLFDFHRKEMSKVNDKFSSLSLEKRLSGRPRIGFVSGDFRDHSVSFFALPLLRRLCEMDVDIYIYANQQASDDRTKKFESLKLSWLNIFDLDDEAVLNRIRSDQLDVLIDLSGHTGGNRLGVFSRRAAPTQISWLGYPGSTCCVNMDYKISDYVCDPEGSDIYYSERLLRMKHVLFCYENDFDHKVAEFPPCKSNEFVTFGSFNNFSKLNDDVLESWFFLLTKVKNSRLFLKGKAYGSSLVQDRLNQYLRRYRISGDRVICHLYAADKRDHMQLYNQIDIALDAHPYSGATTTCEALWMGVPVVTMMGMTHVSRVSGSILSAIGENDLICDCKDSYIETAVDLSNDWTRLHQMKKGLRLKMLKSSLCDSEGFAQEFLRLMHAVQRT